MSDEKKTDLKEPGRTPEQEPEPEPELKQAPRRHSVFSYLALLFAAAFLLLLFSYLMQQRDNREIMGNLSDLRESMGNIESIDQLMEENRTLRAENDTLKTQLDQARTALGKSEDAQKDSQDALEAERARAGELEEENLSLRQQLEEALAALESKELEESEESEELEKPAGEEASTNP